jgi:pimeloyl-ACP methyl ester carboxylesterase
MKRNHLFNKGSLFPSLLVATLFVATTASAQDIDDIQTPESPLLLKDKGSFFVGGEVKEAKAGDLGEDSEPGQITVNQMYVEYQLPQDNSGKVPVVMIHGGGLSGKSYETTPDGRMGWEEYFVRQGHDVYNVDQVSRARSGFDPTIINRVRDGRLPPEALFDISRTSDEAAWVNFRFGPEFGDPWPDTQFPVEDADEFSKQGIPTLNAMLTPPEPPVVSSPESYIPLSELAIELKGAVLMGHSQSSDFPLRAFLHDPTGIKGAIFLETTRAERCLQFTDEEIAQLANVPILFVYGDHLDQQPEGVLAAFNNCNALIDQINAAGGNAQMLWPPELGIMGNTHMFMLDENNLQIADLILDWIEENVGR